VVIKKENDDIKSEATPDSEERIISFLEQNPIDFLSYKAGGKPPVPADMRLVEWLFVDQRMPAGVVNVLVDYVLMYTDGKLPKPLVEKIAGEWQRQKVETTKAAMEKVRKSLNKRKDYDAEKQKPIAARRNYKNATRVEPIPDWLNQKAPVDVATDSDRAEEVRRKLFGGEIDAKA
jgi:replication initiation and membrane attachment protein